MQITVEQIESEVQTLSANELVRVKKTVDSLIKQKQRPQMSEEEFEKCLAKEGFITEYKPPIKDFSRYENYQPVTVTGEPISEMIVRERR